MVIELKHILADKELKLPPSWTYVQVVCETFGFFNQELFRLVYSKLNQNGYTVTIDQQNNGKTVFNIRNKRP